MIVSEELNKCFITGVQGEVESEGPSESECRPYIEKALKELETGEAGSPESAGDTGDTGDSKEDLPTVEITTDDSDHQEGDGDDESHDDGNASTETESEAGQEAQEDQPDETQSDEKVITSRIFNSNPTKQLVTGRTRG